MRPLDILLEGVPSVSLGQGKGTRISQGGRALLQKTFPFPVPGILTSEPASRWKNPSVSSRFCCHFRLKFYIRVETQLQLRTIT
jgi:hypothetical protein